MLLRSLPLSETAPRPTGRVVSLKPVASPARRIASQRLLEGSRELVIEHDGNEYHLRLTRNDKLILTK
jgi:hemin uptake protein HemP